jgi:hypothetical protein
MKKVLCVAFVIILTSIGICLIPATCYVFHIWLGQWWWGLILLAVILIVGASEKDSC